MRAGQVLILGLLGLAGCQMPQATTGWRFEVGKPPTVMSPALVEQTSGPLAIAPISSYPAPSPGAPRVAMAYQQECVPSITTAMMPRPSGPNLAMPEPSGCTMDEICRRLDALGRQMRAVELKCAEENATPPKPMPKSP